MCEIRPADVLYGLDMANTIRSYINAEDLDM
jgi:hypothetical protein